MWLNLNNIHVSGNVSQSAFGKTVAEYFYLANGTFRSIGDSAFSGMTITNDFYLTNLTVNGDIGIGAFYGCSFEQGSFLMNNSLSMEVFEAMPLPTCSSCLRHLPLTYLGVSLKDLFTTLASVLVLTRGWSIGRIVS
eukprot:m.36545 g.36545  ORF g.36545 m.36545 type:complete len:137 (-) comp9140_c0_seq2:2248-2658(-)